MTLQELCRLIGKSENTLKSSFNRTKKNLEKKGIIINKSGRGDNADYSIAYVKGE